MLSTKRVVRFIFAVLLVSVAASCCYAVDVTPFFKIYEDYRQNPLKAEKKWKNEIITIEDTVGKIVKHKDGTVVVLCWRPKPERSGGGVGYMIGFDPKQLPERLFDLKTDQTAKFRGPVLGIIEEDDNVVIVMACLEILD